MENLTFINMIEIARFCKSLDSQPYFREVISQIDSCSSDFEVDNVRFINTDYIDEIQAEELTSDLYVLGCFNVSFIASELNWPVELVKAAQDGEAFEALGKAIVDNADMVSFAKSYSNCDGYGHHFNSYDGSEIEFEINGNTYYVFDNR